MANASDIKNDIEGVSDITKEIALLRGRTALVY